jgi:hypothetical protein
MPNSTLLYLMTAAACVYAVQASEGFLSRRSGSASQAWNVTVGAWKDLPQPNLDNGNFIFNFVPPPSAIQNLPKFKSQLAGKLKTDILSTIASARGKKTKTNIASKIASVKAKIASVKSSIARATSLLESGGATGATGDDALSYDNAASYKADYVETDMGSVGAVETTDQGELDRNSVGDGGSSGRAAVETPAQAAHVAIKGATHLMQYETEAEISRLMHNGSNEVLKLMEVPPIKKPFPTAIAAHPLMPDMAALH